MNNQIKGMTTYQFNVFVKMVIQIVKDSSDKEDAVKKLKEAFEN